jgi:dihydrofolate reductase
MRSGQTSPRTRLRPLAGTARRTAILGAVLDRYAWPDGDQTPLTRPESGVVFSTTLSAVQGNARVASGGPAEEIARLRAEPEESDIAIGGATLAAEAAALGLIDEYRAGVCPVLVGGGIPFFPQRERRVDLELVETRTFGSRVVYLRYRVAG